MKKDHGPNSKIIQITASLTGHEGQQTDVLYLLTEAGDVWRTLDYENYELVIRGGLPTEATYTGPRIDPENHLT